MSKMYILFLPYVQIMNLPLRKQPSSLLPEQYSQHRLRDHLSYCSQGKVASAFRKEIAQSSSDSSRFVVQ